MSCWLLGHVMPCHCGEPMSYYDSPQENIAYQKTIRYVLQRISPYNFQYFQSTTQYSKVLQSTSKEYFICTRKYQSVAPNSMLHSITPEKTALKKKHLDLFSIVVTPGTFNIVRNKLWDAKRNATHIHEKLNTLRHSCLIVVT